MGLTLRPCSIRVGTREEGEKVEAEADEENAIGTAEQLVILSLQNATVRVKVVQHRPVDHFYCPPRIS